jgi:hypothetical protein
MKITYISAHMINLKYMWIYIMKNNIYQEELNVKREIFHLNTTRVVDNILII